MEVVDATVEPPRDRSSEELRMLRAQVAVQNESIARLALIARDTALELRSIRLDTIFLTVAVCGFAWAFIRVANNHADEINALSAALRRRSN